MLFISPAFFWAGALLMAAPIVIHILNRRRFKRVDWAAMDFLLRAMKRNRRRLRFEQIVLLATRCSLLLLLGVALARPLGCQTSGLAQLASTRTGLHVIVIDNSYPMAYQGERTGEGTQLDAAKALAKGILERLSSGGESVAIVTASRPARGVIGEPTYDLRAAEAAIDRIEQSFAGSDESGALALARDIAAGASDQPNKNLYLIDDSRRAAWERDADGIRRTAGQLATIFRAGITHFNVGNPTQWNDAVVDLRSGEPLVTDRFSTDFVADVRGYGSGAGDVKVNWAVDGQAMAAGTTTAHAAAEASPTT
ncbi:MAG: BatA domain-containing protein, partial [Tepidisphaeraceae bacterium]